VGLIDSDYQGQIFVSCWNRGQTSFHLNPLERIAQLVVVPVRTGRVQQSGSFDQSHRGEDGLVVQVSIDAFSRNNFCFLVTVTVGASLSELSVIPLKISGYTISAEVAHTQLSRSQGLMYRESTKENNGMLFVFPKIGSYSMWMKNTYIPLSVAFINEHGVILNIEICCLRPRLHMTLQVWLNMHLK